MIVADAKIKGHHRRCVLHLVLIEVLIGELALVQQAFQSDHVVPPLGFCFTILVHYLGIVFGVLVRYLTDRLLSCNNFYFLSAATNHMLHLLSFLFALSRPISFFRLSWVFKYLV